MRRPPVRSLSALFAAVSIAALTVTSTPYAALDVAEAHVPARARFARPPARFEPNLGQTDPRVRFTARTRDGALFLTAGEAVLRVGDAAAVRLALEGADPDARAVGRELLPGASNYFVGDPSTWRACVPGYAEVVYDAVYPGVDLVYYGAGGGFEYDFVCAPGADPGRIALRVDGAARVEVDAAGDLVLTTAVGEVRQPAPRIYQREGGARRRVAGGYDVREDGSVGFALAAYDPTTELVIDPELVYATYLGGTAVAFPSPGESARAIAAGADGSAYVVGTTAATDFPVASPLQPALNGSFEDAFVTKLGPDGQLVYSTYLGGRGSDYAYAVMVDAAGAAYVAGTTLSFDFPIRNAFQDTSGGGYDVFLTKLAPDGDSLVYSSYFGGSGLEEQEVALCLDADGGAYLAGSTDSTDLPTVSPFQADYGGGVLDGFLAAVSADGTTLTFATYFGGSGDDNLSGCRVVDTKEGRLVYFAGSSDSEDLPFDAEKASRGDSKRTPVFGSVFPSRIPDRVARRRLPKKVRERLELKLRRLAVPPAYRSENDNDADPLSPITLIFGGVFAPLFRAAAGPAPRLGGVDVHLDFLDPDDLAQRRIVSYGGSGQDYPGASAFGPDGELYVVGDTNSDDLPTIDPVQAARAGGEDAFLVAFAPGSYDVAFATYLGGMMNDRALGVAVDAQGNVYVAGWTDSEDFPVTPGALGASLKGFRDPFVAKFSPVGPFEPNFGAFVAPASLTARRGQKGEVEVELVRTGGFDGRVTVTAPDTRAIKVKVTPASTSTTSDRVTFNYKVKKKAQPGTYDLVFRARDDAGRERTASLTLVVE